MPARIGCSQSSDANAQLQHRQARGRPRLRAEGRRPAYRELVKAQNPSRGGVRPGAREVLSWSGRLDLNQRPPAPEAGALPGYATPRSSCPLQGPAGAPGRTRTSNLLIRSQMLYPIELRAPSADVWRNSKRRNTTQKHAAQTSLASRGTYPGTTTSSR